jgi:hypothetical protein
MDPVFATYHDGRVELETDVDWPDGVRLAVFVCQACFVSWRWKSSAGRDEGNRKARRGCPSRGGI